MLTRRSGILALILGVSVFGAACEDAHATPPPDNSPVIVEVNGNNAHTATPTLGAPAALDALDLQATNMDSGDPPAYSTRAMSETSNLTRGPAPPAENTLTTYMTRSAALDDAGTIDTNYIHGEALDTSTATKLLTAREVRRASLTDGTQISMIGHDVDNPARSWAVDRR